MISVFQFYGAGNDIPIQNSRLYQHPCFLFVLEFQGYGKIMVTFQTIRRFARISPEHEDVINQISGIKNLPGCLVNQRYECISSLFQFHQREIRFQCPFSVTYGFGRVFKTFAKGDPAIEIIHTVVIFYPDDEFLVYGERGTYGADCEVYPVCQFLHIESHPFIHASHILPVLQ